jgi:exopolyphosphatase/guanosine-5'-triphosphate,3'-diphosphate pyrophosphatase
MLHDIGMFIGRNGHHKHSYYLIKHSGLLGHSEEEVGIIAAIARYHRGSEPKEAHEAFYTVSPENRKVLTDMAAILRVAEALDRSHKQVIERVTVAMQPFQKGGYEKKLLSLIVKLKSGENCYSEGWALLEKKEFFENQFQVRLSLQVQAEAGYAVKSNK